jgi:preprotein translocase subunit YajC
MVLMYFMMIRPQQKQQKELMALLASVKVGDRVVLRDGLHGQIAKLTEKTVTLQVDSVQMTYDRTSIARVERNEAATPDAKKS